MNVRKTLLAIALAGSFAAPLAVYSAGINFNVDVAPPAPVYEQLPAREGFVVTPGYYRYDEQRRAHTWVKGEYQPERKGEHFVAPEWKQQDGRYGFAEGRWEHDK
jgi:hypothetical protein